MKTTYQTAHNLCIWITIIFDGKIWFGQWDIQLTFVKKYNLVFFHFVTHYEIVNVGTKNNQRETDSYFSFFKNSSFLRSFFSESWEFHVNVHTISLCIVFFFFVSFCSLNICLFLFPFLSFYSSFIISFSCGWSCKKQGNSFLFLLIYSFALSYL